MLVVRLETVRGRQTDQVETEDEMTVRQRLEGERGLQGRVLGERLEVVVLPKTPAALSLGRLAVKGYHFDWPAYATVPILTGPNGDDIKHGTDEPD